VERLTVYRHFPTEEALFAACSAHFLELHPPPGPEVWAGAGPGTRLRAGVVAWYRYYRTSAAMMRNLLRDAELAPVVERYMASSWASADAVAEAVAAGLAVRLPGMRAATATLALALATDWR